MTMNTTTKILGALALAGSAYAGEAINAALPEKDGKEYVSFSADARLRYEHRNAQGADASHAGTFRVRPGITILPDSPLNLFFETEHTIALIEDYDGGPGNTTPNRPGNTGIADPETNEINRAFLKYSKDGFTAKVGRQRIILDKAAFVGNVGWRQNEQTYDAVSLAYKKDKFSVFYAYADQVNRIFGSDAPRVPGQALEGDVHLFNASYKVSDTQTSGAYIYLMDFEGPGFSTNMSNNTFGTYTDLTHSSGKYHFEFAYQTEAGNKADYDAFYGALSYSKKVGKFTLNAGIEYLEDGFVTPLATVHAYNGFADAFIGNRLGVVNTWNGLTDLYVGASTKLDNGFVLKAKLHQFMDDDLEDTYGWEADFVVVKKLTDNAKLLSKFAYFKGDNSSVFNNDIAQASVQIDYKF